MDARKLLIPFAILSLATGCGKKDSDDKGQTGTNGGPGGNGGGGGGASPVAVTGTIALDAVLALLGEAPDTVIAVPLQKDGSLKIHTIAESTATAVVAADGSFTLNVDDGVPHVVIAVDSTAADPVDGMTVIAMPAGDDALQRLPTDGAVGTIDLGDVTPDASGDLVAAAGVADNTAALPADAAETLGEVAKVDDGIRHAKNAAANVKDNGDGTKTFLESSPFVTFSLAAQDARDAFAGPTAVAYTGFGLGFFSNNKKLNFDKACDATQADHLLIEVVPPKPLTLVNTEWVDGAMVSTDIVLAQLDNGDAGAPNTDSLGSNTYKSCGSGSALEHGQFYTNHDDGQEGLMWNFGAGHFKGEMPPGKWIVKAGGEKIGAVDLASAHPLDKDGHPSVYIPDIKIVTDTATGVIKGFDVKWNTWNKKTGAFEEVTKLDAFKKVVTEIAWGITNFSGGCGGGTSAKAETGAIEPPASGATFTVTGLEQYGFLYPDKNTAHKEGVCGGDAIAISYKANGVGVLFDIRVDWTREQ